MGCNCGKRKRAGSWIIIDPSTGLCAVKVAGRCVEYATAELAASAGNDAGLGTNWAIREKGSS